MANEVRIPITVQGAGAAKQALTSTGQAATGLGRSVQRVGEIAQGIIAAQMFQQIGDAASRFLGQARDASSNLGESMNAVNVVFKGAAGGIHALGETAATSMGLSENAFNAAAVRFSAFAQAVAGPGGDVTTTIKDITQRSSDFASVMNLDVNEAMEVFQSGLAGESEPLRRYGIDVSAAAVQTFAYAEGIAQAGAELTEGEKIQARYGLIMQQTEQMAGDFANTSDGLANSQRIFNAEMENAQATVGQLMVPALAALNAVLIPMVQAFSDAPRPIQVVVGALVLLGAGILAVTSRIAPMIIAMQAAGISMGTLATRARSATLAFGPVVAAITAVALVVGTVGDTSAQAAGDVSELTNEWQHFIDTGQAVGHLKTLVGDAGLSFDEIADKMKSASQSTFGFNTNINRTFKEIQQNRQFAADLNTVMAELVRSGQSGEQVWATFVPVIGETNLEFAKANGLLPDFVVASERAAAGIGKTADATGGAGGAAAAAADDLAELGELFGFAGDKAADAAGKMLDAWGAASSDFVTVGGVFDRVLDRKNAAEKSSAGSSGKSAAEVAEAHEDAAERVEKASRAVERAKEDEARAIEDAAERVEQAEDRLADTQRAARDAQRALVDARREAAAQLAEFADRIIDAELSEEAATLRLIRAGNQLAEVQRKRSGASDLDRREADLAMAQARRNLQQVQEDLAGLRSEEEQAQRTGVEGSDLVQDALARQREAAEGVIEAQEGVADAQRESARAMSDAAQRVADAQESMAEAAEDATKVIEDSAGGAGSAMRGLADDTTVTVDEYIEELDRMVREQEEWAQNLIDLSAKVPPAMLDELARLGPEGSAEVALLNSMSSAELDKVIGLFERKGRTSGRGFAENLAEAGPVLTRIARTQGRRTANQLAAEMLRSGDNVFEAAKRLGLFIDRGLGGDRSITVRVNEQIVRQHGVNAPQLRRAHGGITGAEGSAQGGGIRGGLTLVGEQGPELARFPRGTMITPTASTRAMLNGSGGGGGPVDVRVSFDFTGVNEGFAREIRKSIRVDNLLQANA